MDFLISEADEENVSIQEEEDRDITPTVSDNEFIDDADVDDILAADYAAFEMLLDIITIPLMMRFLILIMNKNRIITVMTMMKVNYQLMNLKIIRKKLNLSRKP